MSSRLCCTQPGRARSPETPAVRHSKCPTVVGISGRYPLPRNHRFSHVLQHHPSSSNGRCYTTLTSNDGHGMDLLNSTTTALILPHWRISMKTDETETSALIQRKLPSTLRHIIRTKISDESSQVRQRLADYRSDKVRGSKARSNSDLFGEKSPSQGGYDPDAESLIVLEMSDSSRSSTVILTERNLTTNQTLKPLEERSEDQVVENEECQIFGTIEHAPNSKRYIPLQAPESTSDLSCKEKCTASDRSRQSFDAAEVQNLTINEQNLSAVNVIMPLHNIPFISLPQETTIVEQFDQDQNLSRGSSVHLQNMRISQHLRSLSSLSNDSTAQSYDVIDKYAMLDVVSPNTQAHGQTVRCRSSSGFTSVKVPPSWGKVRLDAEPNSCNGGFRSAADEGCNTSKAEFGYTNEQISGRLQCNAEPRPIGNLKIENVASVFGNSSKDVDSQKWYSKNNAMLSCGASDLSPCQSARDNNHPTIIMTKSVTLYDGPSDRLSAPPDPTLLRPSIPSRRGSVAENFDEAACVWTKALKGHQDSGRPSSHGRGSISVHPFPVLEMELSRNSDGEGRSNDPLHDRGRKSNDMPSIVLTPINAEISFDRLTVPGRGSICQPPSPVLIDQPLKQNHPHPVNLHAEELKNSGVTTDLSEDLSTAKALKFVPSTTPTSMPRHCHTTTKRNPRPALQAWSRYPSHTRNERSLSAGALDNVITRDFAPLTGKDHISGDTHEHGKSMGHLGKQKKRAKGRHLVWLIKSLPGWPARYIRRNSGFRQRESGHRSSIFAGGVLEYPELELIPGAEATISPDWNESSPFSLSENTHKSQLASEMFVAPRRPDSGLGSYEYDTISHGSPSIADPCSSQRLPVDWSAYYGEDFAGPIRRPTDLVSPFDGECNKPPRLPFQSVSIRSLLVPLRDAELGYLKARRPEPASLEEMRKSTRDLRKMLDEGMQVEATQAVEAAEYVWRD